MISFLRRLVAWPLLEIGLRLAGDETTVEEDRPQTSVELIPVACSLPVFQPDSEEARQYVEHILRLVS